MRRLEGLRRHIVVRQFVKFAIVGIGNVALYFVFFNVGLVVGVPVLGANAVAFFLASINSFAWNKTWTFRDSSRRGVVVQYLRFLGFTLVGLGLNSLVLWLLLFPLGDYGTVGKNLAALGAIPISVIWNFTSYRLWTFQSAGHDADGGSLTASER